MPVAFIELEGSPTIEVRDGQIAAARVFRVAWDDLTQFVNELWGSWSIVGGTFVFTLPAEFPGLPLCIVHEIAAEPFDAQSPLGATLSDLNVGLNSRASDGRLSLRAQ